MFNAIASRYDLLNRVLSFGIDRRWRGSAVRALRGGPVEEILDVATGTGDLALEILRMNPRRVVGVDISEEMLSVARSKARRKGADKRVVFQHGDAEALPFEDGAFDAALVAFGVRNFQNLSRGLSELCRVVRPGGRVVVLEFSRPKYAAVRAVYGWYNSVVLPRVGQMISRVQGAYTYLPESIRVFPSGEAFLSCMREAGFARLRAQPLTLGVASLYVGHVPESVPAATRET